MTYKTADIKQLVPEFAERVETVLARMRARGFSPVLFSTGRTQAQAELNAARGTGVKLSMHLYGVAADVICGEHGWSCDSHKHPELHHGFYEAFGEEVKATHSVWGGDWNGNDKVEESDTDRDHMQGVSIRQQARVRAIGFGTTPSAVKDRRLLVRAFYGLV